MPPEAAPYQLILEASVAVLVMAAFVVTSFFNLKERHRDASAWHVHIGAAVYGAVFGLVLGFGVLPFRLMIMEGELPEGVAAGSGVAIIAVMIALRRGLIGRLPFLGTQLKAYRRALLRKSIEDSEKQLARLTPADSKPK